MELVYLGIVFVAVILLMGFGRPLYEAVPGGLLLLILLFRVPIPEIFRQTLDVFVNWSSFSVLVSLYLIACLQNLLDRREQIKLAQQDLNGLFHNRRVNAAGASLFIGLLPSAAAMILCGDIVKDATEGYLDRKEQAFVTSWFRHIPESTLPTYAGVLLMLNLSKVPLSQFLPGMLIPVVCLFLLGYFPALKKLPKDPGTPKSADRKRDALQLVKHLWTLLLILVLMVGFKVNVVPSVAFVLLLAVFVYRIPLDEIPAILKGGFQKKLLLNTFFVLLLKEFIAYTGSLALLPDALSRLPIPAYLVFALLYFFGGIISGTNGIIALATPLAFAVLPSSMPLVVLFMCMCHGASQISPTHLCLVVAADYFHISLGQLVRKTLPKVLFFCLLMILYYKLLSLVF